MSERNIPLNTRNLKLTRRWFQRRNQKTWSTFLPNRFPQDCAWNVIQIGVFEGADLVWQFQNTLQHHDSRAVAIDPWLPTQKLDMERVYQRAVRNLAPWKDQIQIVRGVSQDVLPRLLHTAGKWDLVVIDGDHRRDAVFVDAALSLQLARPGGWLLFDDVRNRTRKRNHVTAGIQMWLKEHGDLVKLAWQHRHCDCYEKVS